ncbi:MULTISPECIES: hypothetical protein [Acinetobacter]|jgi:hypothetical protein|uniref:hypothetical protein n=1 Tax=Acinetobacter TaxID=469 RepID=UPI000837CD20|nr:hypothetical protein [Acinetobacter pittii]OCY43377.1 hypothetical protein BFR77_07080 [Acinetobacter pittii]
MQVQLLSLDANSAQIRIQSDKNELRGIWVIQNLAPYHEQFKSLISSLEVVQNPDEVFNEIRDKYRLRRTMK